MMSVLSFGSTELDPEKDWMPLADISVSNERVVHFTKRPVPHIVLKLRAESQKHVPCVKSESEQKANFKIIELRSCVSNCIVMMNEEV